MNHPEEFGHAIRTAGMEPPTEIIADGKIHRFASNGKRNDDAGWYVYHGDGIAAGAFGDWRTGISETWRADIGRTLTPAEEAAHRSRVEAMRRQRKAEERRRHADSAKRAEVILKMALPAPGDHPYLLRKGIKAHGAKLHDGALVIPIRDDAALHSLQFIDADGEKQFLTGGRVAGCYFAIGNPNGAAALCIAEGFATGATIREATGYPVAVAFNTGNLEAVAQALRDKFADHQLIVCADDDVATAGNPGVTKAKAAALAVGGKLAIPDFGADRPAGVSDFNDLAALNGVEAVAGTIANAMTPASNPKDDSTARAARGRRPIAVRISDVQREEVTWLWCDRIPRGKLTIIEGDPGEGKSFLSQAIAAAVSVGCGLPGEAKREPESVVIMSAEDGLADTIRPRLEDMGADLGRVVALRGLIDDKNRERPLTLADLDVIEEVSSSIVPRW
jgi:putative DNA primase/helicase